MKFYTSAERVGNNIFHRYIEIIDGTAIQQIERVEYQPTIYIPNDTQVENYFTDFEGRTLAPLPPFSSMREANEYAKELKNSGVDVFGQPKHQYAFLDETYPGGEGIEADISKVEVFCIDIETECEFGFPDPRFAPEPVNAITIHSRQLDKYITLSTFDFEPHLDNCVFKKCVDEKDLLVKFVAIMQEMKPEILTGWNIRFFDIPYLVNRITNLLGKKVAKSISPFNMLGERNIEVFGREQQTYDISGIAVLDYIELYKKFTYNLQESYKLDFIAQVELGEKKVDYSEYGVSLHHLYKANPQRFLEYNVHDVTLVKRLDDKLLFIDLAMLIAYRAKVNFDDVFGQVGMWDALTVNYLKNNKKILSPYFPERGAKSTQFTGAYVRQPIRGLYKWVVSFDLNSLYPSIIMGLNISPEMLFDKKPWLQIDDFVDNADYQNQVANEALQKKACIAANGAYFKREKTGFLPEILDNMYSERKRQKATMLRAQKLKEAAKERLKSASGTVMPQTGIECLDWETRLDELSEAGLNKLISECDALAVVYDARQMATKINLNSCFGVLGNPHFRWYDVNQAEAITVTGQLAIKWIAQRLNEFLGSILGKEAQFTVYGDTDSVYIDFSGIVEKYWSDKDDNEVVDALDALCQKKVEPYIDEQYKKLESLLNAASARLVMAREAIGPAAFFQKKRYIMNVFDNEGIRYAEPKMKVMGLESVRSTTPSHFRDHLKSVYKLILTKLSEEPIQKYVQEVKHEFAELDINKFARPTGVNNIEKYDNNENTKGIPAHVRASIVYNKLLDKYGLDKELPKIVGGDKVKFVYLKEPNPAHSHVVGYVDELPKEFGLHDFIDREKMLNDAFIAPVERTIETFGWSVLPRVDLMSMLEDDDYSPETSGAPTQEIKVETTKQPEPSMNLEDFFGED